MSSLSGQTTLSAAQRKENDIKAFGLVIGRKILFLIGLLVVLAALLLVSPAWAVETRSGDEVVIGPDEIIEDDLYVTANESSWKAP